MNRKGSILIISLWVLFLLSAFAVMLGVQVRQKLVLVKRVEARNKLRSLAEAGVQQARVVVRSLPQEQNYHALRDSWSVNPALFERRPLGDGFYSVYVDIPADADTLQQRRYGLVDEESKLNLNTLTGEDNQVFVRLLQLVLGADETQAQSVAAAVVDWKDEDNVVSAASAGAEDAYYHSLPAPYDAKDKPFQRLEELLLIRGITADTYARLQPYLTVYGSGRINVNTASRYLLLAAGLPERVVAAMLEYRGGKDGIAGTADDGVFASISDIGPVVSQSAGLTLEQLSQTNDILTGRCGVSSSAFYVNSRGFTGRGGEYSQIECVVDNQGTIVYYHQQ